MNLDRLQRLVGTENVSISVEDRIVYGRDASHIKGDCLAVVWPTHPEQMAGLVEWARDEAIDLVPRGAGTGLCGGATPQHSVVVDLSRLTHIDPVDTEQHRIRVGAGVVLETLNRQLRPYNLFLPVIPGSHRVATIGGMIATNAAGLRAVRYGPMRNWVEAISLVDGLGHLHHLTKATLDDAIGREGVTGFVVEATLRLTSLPVWCTVTLQAFDDEVALLARRDEWLADSASGSGLSALEYLNRHAAVAIGWSPRPHLLAEFESDDGMINDPTLVADLWRLRDGLYPALARKGRHVIEDPQIEGTGQAACLAWLDVEGIPTFGHLGVNIVHPCFDPNDDRVAALYERLPGWGGQISGEHGIGLKKKSWTTTEFQADIQRLKKIYDPQNIINRRKLC